jgi:hypothetical protein
MVRRRTKKITILRGTLGCVHELLKGDSVFLVQGKYPVVVEKIIIERVPLSQRWKGGAAKWFINQRTLIHLRRQKTYLAGFSDAGSKGADIAWINWSKPALIGNPLDSTEIHISSFK